MNLSGFIGRRLTKTMPLYFDFGGYIGIPLSRNVVDSYHISTPANSNKGTNYDPNEYLNKLEFGIIIKAGFQFKVSDKIAMIGVGYILIKQQ